MWLDDECQVKGWVRRILTPFFCFTLGGSVALDVVDADNKEVKMLLAPVVPDNDEADVILVDIESDEGNKENVISISDDEETVKEEEISIIKEEVEAVVSKTPRRLKTSKKRRFVDNDIVTDDSPDDAGMIDANDAVTIFNLLLLNPEKHEQKKKPIAIREYHLCTYNKSVIPMERARPDDNGAYERGGTPTRDYKLTFSDNGEVIAARTCHFDKEKENLFITVRTGSKYQRQYLDSKEDVYTLRREYRKGKHNPRFYHVLATISRYGEDKWCNNYYMSCYFWKDNERHSWKDGTPDEIFFTPRHGNAKKPTAPAYFKTEPAVLNEAKTMLQSNSPSFVYSKLSSPDSQNSPGNSPSFSGQIRNPRQLYNMHKNGKEDSKDSKESEFERMTHMVKNPNVQPFVRSVVMLEKSYASFAFTEFTMKNLERCCVLDASSVLRVDTTFEIVDGMWVTDTSYTNISLINESNAKHPEFPGPVMLHFQKDAPIFRRFALEIVNGNPKLLDVKKVGHDMDNAIKKGFGEIFRNAENLICIQHVSERDRLKLQKLGATKQDLTAIMTDIYGYQANVFQESGLTDSADADEFTGRLESLKDVWEHRVKGFHAWFVKKRAPLFKDQVVGEALDRLKISEKFTTNRLENLHKVQKAFCQEGNCKGDAVAVLKGFENWLQTYEREAEKAFYGQGKFRLAPGYDGFQHPTYLYWSEEAKREHQEKFASFVPVEANTYQRPAAAGRKTSNTKTKRGNSEVELFGDRLQQAFPRASPANPASRAPLVTSATSASPANPASRATRVTSATSASPANPASLATRVTSATSDAEEDAEDPEAEEDLSFLDPFRVKEKQYFLVHRKDKKNCPPNTTRCESCKIAFDSTDQALIKSSAIRDITCRKTGKQTKKSGNVYFHNLWKCANDHDRGFQYCKVTCLKTTYAFLSAGGRAKVKKLNMKMEK